MPRGKWSGHKGKSRKFTNPDELEAERKKDEQERAWRKARGDPSSEEEEEEASAVKPQAVKTSDDSSSESEESEDEDAKGKGVEKLIEISNPNRVQQKAKKLATLNETLGDGKTELTRKEREELEKQQAAARYRKLHAEGKTNEAQADLARLAIIKKQREDAAKKREAERLQKEAELKEKSAARDKALGKKS